MTYDVFIVDGSVFDPDTSYIKFDKVTQIELDMLEDLVCRQTNMDFVIRPSREV